jgi:hypothetical protein
LKTLVRIAALLILPVPVFGQEVSKPDNPVPKISTDREAGMQSYVAPKPAATTAHADAPKRRPWYKDLASLLIAGSSLGASAANTYESHECRMRKDAGIAFCNGGYGPFAARQGINFGTAVLMTGLSLWGRHEGFKEWAAPSLGFTAYNTYEAVHQSQIGCPAGTVPVYGTKYNCEPAYKNSW